MRIYVTGAKGQLGRALMRRLAHHTLLGTDLPEVDLTDLNAIRSSLAAFAPGLVIHAAAYTDVDGAARQPDLAYRVNALGTRNVVVASEAIGAAVLAISTNEVFDGAHTQPYLEFDAPRPINPYAKSKLAAEQFIRDPTTRFYIVRTAWLYGLGGNNFVKKIIDRADSDGQLRVVTDEVSSPTYTEDLVTTIEQLMVTARTASITSPTTARARASNSRRRFWPSAAAATSRSNRSCWRTIRAPRRRRPTPRCATSAARRSASPCARGKPRWRTIWRVKRSDLETGNWRLEIGNWKLEVGNWKLEASWKLEVGDARLHAKRPTSNL